MERYWSRIPGHFVDQTSGKRVGEGLINFSGSPREWYETLIETIIDATAGSSMNSFVVFCSPDVRCMIECSVLYKEGNLACQTYGTFKVVADERQSNDMISIFSGEYSVGTVHVLDMP